MNIFYTQLFEKVQVELQRFDLEGCDISIKESLSMIKFLENCLSELKDHFFTLQPFTIENEIVFFKEMKPQILGFLLYFNKIHNIELKCPIGSNETQNEYYEKELKSLTYFFERNLDFHQYYRSNATYLDEQYFIRGKSDYQLCVDSAHYVLDMSFSFILTISSSVKYPLSTGSILQANFLNGSLSSQSFLTAKFTMAFRFLRYFMLVL